MEITYLAHMVAVRMLQVGRQMFIFPETTGFKSSRAARCLTPGQTGRRTRQARSLTRHLSSLDSRSVFAKPRRHQPLNDEETVVAHHLADRFR
jgi:hypothetical protein